MTESKRLELSFWHKLDHYFPVIFVLLPSLLSVYSLVEIHYLDTYDGVRTSKEIAEVAYFWILPAILIAFIQWKRLGFKVYKIEASSEQINDALKQTIEDLNWRIEEKNSKFIRAFRDWDFTASWGEMITIIPTKGSILINSICDPNKRTSLASFGMNKTNTRTFIINLYNIVNGTSILKPEEKEKRWSVGNTIFRVIAYPFCIGLVLLAVLSMISEGEIILGIFCIIIPAYYFYTDLN